jgi:hypothetical protein
LVKEKQAKKRSETTCVPSEMTDTKWEAHSCYQKISEYAKAYPEKSLIMCRDENKTLRRLFILVQSHELFNHTVRIWQGQRLCSVKRVQQIRNSFYEFYAMKKEMPQFCHIVMAMVLEDTEPSFYIIDGQHRYYALKELYANGIDPTVPVDIRMYDTHLQVKEAFLGINACVPATVEDVYDGSWKDRDLIESTISILEQRFPQCFKESVESVMRPYLTSTMLWKAICKNNLVETMNITSTHEFVSKLLNFNDWLKMQSIDFFPLYTCKKPNVSIVEKAKELGLMFGLYRNGEWASWIQMNSWTEPSESSAFSQHGHRSRCIQ